MNWSVPHPAPLPEGEGIACALSSAFVSRGLQRQGREGTNGRERTQKLKGLLGKRRKGSSEEKMEIQNCKMEIAKCKIRRPLLASGVTIE